MQCRITLESRANSVAMKMHWLGRESVATASTIYFLPPDAVQFHRRMETKELDVTILLAKRLAMDLLCAFEGVHWPLRHPRGHAVECADREIGWTAVI